MLNDMTVVLWKELREILFPDGRAWGGAKNLLIMLGIGGLMFPLETGPRWFTSWLSISTACFPVILVVNYTADVFAGERERHTLETLLASRLDTSAVFLGKMLAIILYAWGLVLACQVVALVALNVVHRDQGLMFYRPEILGGIVAMSALVSLLLCSVGTVLSLTAPTVRVAGQRMLIPFLAIFVAPGLLPYLVQRLHWERYMSALTPGLAVVLVGALCALLAAGAIAVGLKRFTRERVVLA